MEYSLKNKIPVTKEFLEDLAEKGWQEIEQLRNQIANIEPTPETAGVVQSLKNLLTSYYVFTGTLETLSSETVEVIPAPTEVELPQMKMEVDEFDGAPNFNEPPIQSEAAFETIDFNEPEVIEPFEYFVDFDEPEGEPLSDEDLYGN